MDTFIIGHWSIASFRNASQLNIGCGASTAGKRKEKKGKENYESQYIVFMIFSHIHSIHCSIPFALPCPALPVWRSLLSLPPFPSASLEYDKTLYKQRHKIENMFGKLQGLAAYRHAL